MVRNHSTAPSSTQTICQNQKAGDASGVCLQNALKAELLALPFCAFAACICDLLRAEGYTAVRLAGRATYRGRNKEGGFDMEAFLPSPLGQTQPVGNGVLRRKVIVQVKQFPQEVRVYQRTLDALRGAILRTGAIEAVLITTSDFSPIVRNVEATLRREAGSGSLAPVHLMNGAALAERLILHRIGVKIGEDGQAAIDLDYFARLKTVCRDSKMAEEAAAESISTIRRAFPAKDKGLHARISRTQTEVTLTLPLTLFTAHSETRTTGMKGGA